MTKVRNFKVKLYNHKVSTKDGKLTDTVNDIALFPLTDQDIPKNNKLYYTIRECIYICNTCNEISNE